MRDQPIYFQLNFILDLGRFCTVENKKLGCVCVLYFTFDDSLPEDIESETLFCPLSALSLPL